MGLLHATQYLSQSHVTFFWLFASCFRLLVFLTKYTRTLYPKNGPPHSVCTATESDISVLIEYSNELIFYIFELIVILAYHHRISSLTVRTVHAFLRSLNLNFKSLKNPPVMFFQAHYTRLTGDDAIYIGQYFYCNGSFKERENVRLFIV
jgi:hypothetical protein